MTVPNEAKLLQQQVYSLQDELADTRDELREALKNHNRLQEQVLTHWLVADDARLVETIFHALACDWYRPEGPRDFGRDTEMRRGLALEVAAGLRGEYEEERGAPVTVPNEAVEAENEDLANLIYLLSMDGPSSLAQRINDQTAWLTETVAELRSQLAALRVFRDRAAPNGIHDTTGPTGPGGRPEIVVLCGSTRFKDAFYEAGRRLSYEGRIVLTVSDLDMRPENRERNVPMEPAAKAALDELHKRKIDLADRVLVLNVGGYVGESTRSEVNYATEHGKPIDYLEGEHP